MTTHPPRESTEATMDILSGYFAKYRIAIHEMIAERDQWKAEAQRLAAEVRKFVADNERLLKGRGTVCEAYRTLETELALTRQRAVDAEMELLALKSPVLPQHIRERMDADRAAAQKGLNCPRCHSATFHELPAMDGERRFECQQCNLNWIIS